MLAPLFLFPFFLIVLFIQGGIQRRRQESCRSYESRETIRIRWYIKMVSENSHYRFVGRGWCLPNLPQINCIYVLSDPPKKKKNVQPVCWMSCFCSCLLVIKLGISLTNCVDKYPIGWIPAVFLCCVSVFLFPVPGRTTFSVDPDTHIDSIDQAEQMTIEGTSKWSCKIAITGIAAFYRDAEHKHAKVPKKINLNSLHFALSGRDAPS